MNRATPLLPKLLLNAAYHIERTAAFAQGKGYGASSIIQENELVQQLLKRRSQLAIDIGGNIGDYTAELRRRNPLTEIHTFEPCLKNATTLKNRFVKDNKVFIIPVAISDRCGRTALYSNESGSGLGSLTQRRLEHLNINFNVTEPVSTIRFEDYWRETLNRRHLDIVKIDIEGHEMAALTGFGEAISSVSVIQFEFGGCNIDTRSFFQDFWYFFVTHGFEVYRITPLGLDRITRYKERDEVFSTTNFIAVKK